MVTKRLILCCDGTWMNSDIGYEKASIFNPKAGLQVPSNVTRIARCFKQVASDGKVQVINYESGVGTGSNTLDTLFGGAFGTGLSERVREAYHFICANYSDGDDIILIGFSRGAYTARCVAGMIGDLGLLTREGFESFYPIFKDMENWMNDSYNDPFPDVPFADKPRGIDAPALYRQRLADAGLTRVHQDRGRGPLIKVKAVAVWDTVGSLGIPQVSWLTRIGITPSNKEYQFYDTNLSDRIENAFQALALDETRPPFPPAVWERLPTNANTTDLRQVWFPGTHSNCGGGWPDQGQASISLAWMMDQLASIGVEFDDEAFTLLLDRSNRFYETSTVTAQWGARPLYESNRPFRPWALAAIEKSDSWLYTLAGSTLRTPGAYRQADPKTGNKTKAGFLRDTNEKMHPSVRVRLACQGLGLDDKGPWANPAMKGWALVKRDDTAGAAASQGAGVKKKEEERTEGGSEEVAAENWGPAQDLQEMVDQEGWGWEWVGDAAKAPPVRRLEESVMGPYERFWLKKAGGKDPSTWRYASQKGQ